MRSFFEANAATTAIVHGIYVRSVSHQTCERKIFTGVSSGTGPDSAAMVANEHARDYALPYLITGNRAYAGQLGVITGRFGAQGQLNALLDPADAYPRQSGADNYHDGFKASPDDEARIRAYIDARAQRERAGRGQWGHNRDRVDDFVESLDKGDLLRANADAFGSRGAELSLIDQVGLALDALEQDLCWSVGIATSGFDTHDDNDRQAGLQDDLFNGLGLLADQLRSRGLFDDTVVAVFSEMSRTTQRNADDGKDHHDVTSALVFGGGVAGGVAYGANDDDIQGEKVDFATGEVDRQNGQHIDAANFVAGVVCLAGADPAAYLPNSEPFTAFIG